MYLILKKIIKNSLRVIINQINGLYWVTFLKEKGEEWHRFIREKKRGRRYYGELQGSEKLWMGIIASKDISRRQ